MPSLLRDEVLAATPEGGRAPARLPGPASAGRAAADAQGLRRARAASTAGSDGVNGRPAETRLALPPARPTRSSSTICAPARGVVATAGFSLMSEAVYLRKPMLALPLTGQFEQEMNARYLGRSASGRPRRRSTSPRWSGSSSTSRASPRRWTATVRTATQLTLVKLSTELIEEHARVNDIGDRSETLLLFAWALIAQAG